MVLAVCSAENSCGRNVVRNSRPRYWLCPSSAESLKRIFPSPRNRPPAPLAKSTVLCEPAPSLAFLLLWVVPWPGVAPVRFAGPHPPSTPAWPPPLPSLACSAGLVWLAPPQGPGPPPAPPPPWLPLRPASDFWPPPLCCPSLCFSFAVLPHTHTTSFTSTPLTHYPPELPLPPG